MTWLIGQSGPVATVRPRVSCKKCGTLCNRKDKLCYDCANICAECGGYKKPQAGMCRACRKGKPRTPHSLATRRKQRISHIRYLATKQGYDSKLERRAGELLPGFKHRFALDRHQFDYGDKEKKIVVEVNGCRFHLHTCGIKPVWNPSDDKRWARIAKRRKYRLIILWQCEEKSWNEIIGGRSGQRIRSRDR